MIVNGARVHAGRMLGQQSIFGEASEQTTEAVQEWSDEELLKYEKEALGFYITGHPVRKYDRYLEKLGTKRLPELEESSDGQEVRIGGILTGIRKIQTKSKAEIMAYCTLEDAEANIEVIVFPDLYKNSLAILQKDTPLLVKGTVDKTEKGVKIVAHEIARLDANGGKREQKAELTLRFPLPDGMQLQTLKSVLLSDAKGEFPLFMRIVRGDTETLIATGMKISRNHAVINRIEAIAGKGAMIFQ
jgi:DNA polymerase-3 subunit alpha